MESFVTDSSVEWPSNNALRFFRSPSGSSISLGGRGGELEGVFSFMTQNEARSKRRETRSGKGSEVWNMLDSSDEVFRLTSGGCISFGGTIARGEIGPEFALDLGLGPEFVAL